VWLRSIEADRLRNLDAVRLELPRGLTVIAGRNGQGKTSLLEAVYLLGTGRSFRTHRQDDLVAWSGGPLRVAGLVGGRGGESRLTVAQDGGQRSLLADGAEKDLEEFIGRLDVVDLTAERMKVLRGGPEERRRFLDRGLVGLRPAYLRSLGEYRRTVQQRNALLRTVRGAATPDERRQIDVWDERLALAGAEIHRRRRGYAKALNGLLDDAVRAFFPGGATLRIVYRPSPAGSGESDPDEFAALFRERLERGRIDDLEAGHTGRGPHRDELRVELDGVDLRRFGSAGQVRAAMVALKMAKLALLRQERSEAPVFLMDDFDSHLDEARATALGEFLREGGSQVLAATSKEVLADGLGVAFHKVIMKEGRARAESS
jgi:DNA replication and repair protein RecF